MPSIPFISPALPRGLFAEGLDGQLYLAAANPGACAVWWREPHAVFRTVAPVEAVQRWAAERGATAASFVASQLAALHTAPRTFAGLRLDRPRIMGILNVTPDSFSDGGRHLDTDGAVAHGLAMAEAGADLIDVGGESTRPGAEPVSPDEECRRVLPVVSALAARGIAVSIDTRHAMVMDAAAGLGARIINDVTALAGDPAALAVAARRGAAVVLMHMRGDPRTMQTAPRYRCVVLDVYDRLKQRLDACRSAGIPMARLCVDPGIGFGKTVAHNTAILGHLGIYRSLGVPLLLGVSRKRFIATLSHGESPDRRLPGSLAGALAAVAQGAQIVRVHDVAETAQALAVWRAIGAAVSSR